MYLEMPRHSELQAGAGPATVLGGFSVSTSAHTAALNYSSKSNFQFINAEHTRVLVIR